MTNIVVIGAGVTGLTVAHELLMADPENKVTIVSKNFPTDFKMDKNYTSPIAGANWESFATDEDLNVQQIDTVGYRKFIHFAKTRPEAGVTARLNRVLVTMDRFKNVDNSAKHFPWFQNLDPNFRELRADEYDTKKFAYGYEFDSIVIRTSYYMTFLINEMWKIAGPAASSNQFSGVPGENGFHESRFNIKRHSLTSIKEAFNLHASGVADIVVNCSGLGAKYLEDIEPEEKEKMVPIRGVVFVLENNTGLDRITVVETGKDEPSDEALYIMPRREGELILGGCFQKGNHSEFVEPSLKNRILSRAQKYLPEYDWSNMKIAREQVGFRPFREGGYRIERTGKIVHCYGMGGAGFQSSWGSAERAVKLVKELKNRKSKI